MTCLNCGYTAKCECNFNNNLCWTCYYKTKDNSTNIVNNYCNQDLPYLQSKKNKVLLKEDSKLKTYQLAMIESQIKLLVKNPCKFKDIINNI